MRKDEQRERLLEIGCALNSIQDLDILMERILTEARRFVSADAGSIYIQKNKLLYFAYTQNDTLQNELKEGEKLLYNNFTLDINDKSIAGYVALSKEILCIDDVYKLAENTPYSFSSSFDFKSKYRSRSMCTLPLIGANQDVLGILQILNPLDTKKKLKNFNKQDIQVLQHFAAIASIALERAKLTRSILMRMIQMAEMRDPKETGAHINRVGSYSVAIYENWAKRRELDKHTIEKQRDCLRMAAMLHDVGKVAIPDQILKKPGPLTEEEFKVMQEHTVYGARLFTESLSYFDKAASDVALTHHERWDGRGYPGYVDIKTGLPLEGKSDKEGNPLPKKGEEIPLFGRIVALADVYDALSNQRAYKEAWTDERVLKHIKEASGSHFDPELVKIFFEIQDTLKQIKERFAE